MSADSTQLRTDLVEARKTERISEYASYGQPDQEAPNRSPNPSLVPKTI